MLQSFFRFLSLSLLSLPLAAAPDLGRIKPHEVAYFVQDLQTGEILAQHNADVAMNPASVMKLVTAYAAFHTLGENYRWRTQWTARAPIVGGTLEGNLFWRGSGDPVLDQKDIIALQQQLQQQGIYHIAGNVVLDRSVWNTGGTAEGFDDDENRVFAVPPNPHMLSYKVVWIDAYPTADGSVGLGLNPPLVNVPIQENVQVVNGGSCSSLARTLKANWDGQMLHLQGRLPTACSGQKMYVNMLSAEQFAAESFIGQWREIGGSGPQNVRFGDAPADVRVLAEHYSPPLSEVLRDMNKHSNNLIARTVFLTLGASASGGQTVSNAKKAIRRSLVQSGISDKQLFLENGSGLSRSERISARTLGALLQQTYYSPFRQPFIDSLPQAGVDGTLKKRLRDVPQLYLKTGTLKDVRSLAGYKLPQNSQEHPLSIVIMVNSPQARLYLQDLDKLARSLAGYSHVETKSVYHAPSLLPPVRENARETRQNVHQRRVSVLQHG
ncbi:MAG: D-alanyl-D-alanine carboxypeptidase/D-alanyl-D-alanine-endopeptidase [Neisseria sp.]|nr:D-alanyl-D-alanine carboxypeptidase/D-alanyl-D-alanine-endopeptidase [Neisseria sp.]